MKVFDKYARYYDLLYKDKDYAAEAEYVHSLLRKYAPGTKSVLELGCGTGKHAHLLSKKGYRLHGVDRSPEMLHAASSRMSTNEDVEVRPSFSLGDIRSVRIQDKFDAVLSLFHVMSYQTTNDDLTASFATAKSHLNQGGVAIFDCWYGPAVLSQRPAVNVKRFEDERVRITRFAEPEMRPAENVVDVNYKIVIQDKLNDRVEELRETHRMRYLFDQEIDSFLSQQGLRLLASFAWMSDRKPGADTWGACYVVQA